MKPLKIINQFYEPGSKAHEILIKHSEAVRDKALQIATNHPELNPDLKFIAEAAMLHDLGIFKTDAPQLGCTGKFHYLCHGYLGKELLIDLGFPEHALVCERHTGCGITLEDIEKQNLPLPVRDYVPVSVEEQIICFADKFFSKSQNLKEEKTVKEVRAAVARFGSKNTARFDEWCELFL